MNSYNENKPSAFHDEFIDIKDLFDFFWTRRLLMIITLVVSLILSVIYAFNLPNMYTSKTVLAPANPDESLSSSLSNISSIGGIAGFSLPETPLSKSDEGIERIKSYDFFNKYFLPNIKLENLVAVKKWDQNKNTFIYDETLFNSDNSSWLGDSKDNAFNKPSTQYAYSLYKNIVTINEDEDSQFIKISVTHKSPIIAKKWLDIIIYQINESMRNYDQEQAKRSISFLSELIPTTQLQSAKEVTSYLLEQQIQILMLTSSNKYYVFKIIDSPIEPEVKAGPNRLKIIFLGVILGGVFSFVIIFFMKLRESLKLNFDTQ